MTILWRQQYPAPLGIALVFQLTYHRTEADTDHEFKVQVIDQDGHPVLPEIQGNLHVGGPDPGVPANVPLAAPVTFPLPPVSVLQRPGSYSVEILLDGRHVKSLPFAVAHPPSHLLEQG